MAMSALAGQERALRNHIHALLYSYAITHLTIDYTSFTHEAVNEVLSDSLFPIPEHDPTCFALEPPLIELISDRFKTSELKEHQERLDLEPDARAHLRHFVRATLTSPEHSDYKSDTIWLEDDEIPYLQTMSPVLTMRAIRQTPKLLGKCASTVVSGPTQHLLDVHYVKEIDTDLIDSELLGRDLEVANIDETLGHKLVMDPETRSAVVDRIRTIQKCSSSSQDQTSGHIRSFIRDDTDDYLQVDAPILLSPPLFARDRMPGGTLLDVPTISRSLDLRRSKDLGRFVVSAQVDSDDNGDLYKEHMAMINGWETYYVPSSPTPSLDSSAGEDTDQLDLDQYLPSSSPSRLATLCDQLLPAKMEEYIIPRTESLGGAQARGRGLDPDQSLSSFLPLLQLAPNTSRHKHLDVNDIGKDRVQISTSRSTPSSPSISVTASMLGQPPTALATEQDLDHTALDLNGPSSDDFGLSKVIKAMYPRNDESREADGPVIDPRDYILKERLDDRECYLMEVPDMPAPNDHPPSGTCFPTTMKALLQKNNALEDSAKFLKEHDTPLPTSVQSMGFLQEVKGLKSLNLELGWRPFNYGTSVPTNEEVAQVDENVQAECVLDFVQSPEDVSLSAIEIEQQLAQLLIGFTHTQSNTSQPENHETVTDKVWLEDAPDCVCRVFCEEDHDDFISTAVDRIRAAGLPDVSRDNSETTASDDEGFAVLDERPAKRLRFSSPVIFEYTPVQSFDYSQLRADQRRASSPLDEYKDEVEDSGVFIPEAFDSHPHDRRFGQLAEEAEDFEGLVEDGEVIPDVDPLLLGDWTSHSLDTGSLPLPRSQDGLGHLWPEPKDSENTDKTGGLLDTITASALDVDAIEYGTPNTAPDGEGICNPSHTTASAGGVSGRPLNVDFENGRDETAFTDSIDALPKRSAKQNLQVFMALRSKNVPLSLDVDSSPPALPLLSIETSAPPSIEVPPELVDNHTLTISGSSSWPSTLYRYMASLEFIQKRGLVQALSVPQCAVQLIEREYLDGADIVLDCDTAVLFSPLRTLPTQCDVLTAAINKLSWRFSYLLVVFESFPVTGSHSHVDAQTELLTVNPFSPPVVKAVKKVRRDIGIAEACYDKRAEATINFAFPLTLMSAARTIRLYGDLAQQRDATGGTLWDDRRWLDADDEDLDERDLAAIDGMNVFSAAVILTNTTLDDFLDRTPEERLEQFSGLIGRYRMNCFNAIIARRKEAMELPSSSPPITSDSTPKATTPLNPIN